MHTVAIRRRAISIGERKPFDRYRGLANRPEAPAADSICRAHSVRPNSDHAACAARSPDIQTSLDRAAKLLRSSRRPRQIIRDADLRSIRPCAARLPDLNLLRSPPAVRRPSTDLTSTPPTRAPTPPQRTHDLTRLELCSCAVRPTINARASSNLCAALRPMTEPSMPSLVSHLAPVIHQLCNSSHSSPHPPPRHNPAPQPDCPTHKYIPQPVSIRFRLHSAPLHFTLYPT